MTACRVLAFAAVSERIGTILMIDGQLREWKVSEQAAMSSNDAAGYAQEMINFYKPNVVVTERLRNDCRKGKHTRGLIAAMALVADQNYVLDISIERRQRYANKYDEAEALVAGYPDLLGWLPKKRRIFDREPRSMVLFEALSLARSVASGSTTDLAAAMG